MTMVVAATGSVDRGAATDGASRTMTTVMTTGITVVEVLIHKGRTMRTHKGSVHGQIRRRKPFHWRRVLKAFQ
jgi:hypothetical protein